MKVLKHGCYYSKRVRCDCGCEYLYEDTDVKHCTDRYNSYTVSYVQCPECKYKFTISFHTNSEDSDEN